MILLVAIAASGWFLVRAILVWGVGGAEYAYRPDILLALTVLLLCSAVIVALRFPPADATAQVVQPNVRRRTVVSGLGDEWRWSFQVGVLPTGLLAVFTPCLIPTALGWAPDILPNLSLGLPVNLAVTAMSVAMITVCARSVLHGVELTPTHLIARGYFWTRRFDRAQITDVRLVDVTGWAATLFDLARMGVTSTIGITLADGSRHVLYASTSRGRDMNNGVDVIRAWTEAINTQAT